MENFGDFMRQMMDGVGGRKKKKFKTVVKVAPEEEIRFMDLERRKKNLQTYVNQTMSKIETDSSRLWADIRDKYNLHGEEFCNLRYKGSTAEIRVPVTADEKEGEGDCDHTAQ